LAHTKSARKMIRVIKRRRTRNKPIATALKTAIIKAERLILAEELEPAKEVVGQTLRTLDKAAQKGIIKSNNAARRKSRLMKRFNKTFPPA